MLLKVMSKVSFRNFQLLPQYIYLFIYLCFISRAGFAQIYLFKQTRKHSKYLIDNFFSTNLYQTEKWKLYWSIQGTNICVKISGGVCGGNIFNERRKIESVQRYPNHQFLWREEGIYMISAIIHPSNRFCQEDLWEVKRGSFS